MTTRDIIVIGGSYGGIEALSYICQRLPATLPAAVFAVIHIPSASRSVLPLIISKGNGLPAFHALEGARIEHGRVYVAPPDHHVLLKEGYMRVVRGPRENRNRPAVDPLFRSAAITYRTRVIGVVLSGYLDDGTAGLSAIKRCGGIAVVQDPKDAVEASMPRNAIDNVKVDYIAAVSDIPALLEDLVQQAAPDPRTFLVPRDMEKEVKVEELDMGTLNNDNRYGEPSAFSCPECGGVLWEIEDGDLVRFRCRVGHAYSQQSIQAEHADTLENALYVALKVLEENATLLRRMILQSRRRGLDYSVQNFEDRLRNNEERASVLRSFLLEKPLETREDPAKAVPQGNNGRETTEAT